MILTCRIQDKFHHGLPSCIKPTLLCAEPLLNGMTFDSVQQGVEWIAKYNANHEAKGLPELKLVGR